SPESGYGSSLSKTRRAGGRWTGPVAGQSPESRVIGCVRTACRHGSASHLDAAPSACPRRMQSSMLKEHEPVSYLSTRPCPGPDCCRLPLLGRLQTETALRLRSGSQSLADADGPRREDRPDD